METGQAAQTETADILASIVMPVYRGARLLDETFARLIEMEKQLPADARVEIVAVDDGSDDDSFSKIIENQKRFPGKIRAVKLARNFGSMAASQAGFSIARGDCVAVAQQDLQDSPPELLLRMFAAWREGVKINIGVRESRDEPMVKKSLAAAYHFLFGRLVMPDYPRGGLGSYLIDRQIADELRRRPESHDLATHVFAMGYSRRLHSYHRSPPPPGVKTGWTVAKNIKLVIDNFIAFSFLPARLMSVCGVVIALASFVFATYVFVGKTTDWYPINQPPGWATIVVLLTFLSGMVMTMLGLIGEYLWRILDAARNRPIFLVDEIREE